VSHSAQQVPQGYKQTEVGVIPDDWQVQTVYQIAGEQKSRFDDGDWVEAEHITNRGVRLIQTGNIGVGRYVEKEAKKYIYAESFTKLRCKELFEGDLLICRLADPAGRACIFPRLEDNKVITSVDVTIYRPDESEVSREYLRQYFSTAQWFRSILEYVGGTTHKRISRGALGRILVPLATFDEQTAIADALSDVDGLIGSLEKLIAKKRAIKTAAMQQLLTGKKRLPPFDQTHTGYKQTDLGEIPNDWEVRKLGEFLKYEQPTKYLVSDTKYSPNGEVPVLTAGKTFILGYTHEEHGIFDALPVIIFDDFTTDTKFVDFRFKAKSSAMKMLLPRTEGVSLHYIFSLMQLIDFPLGDHKRHWIGEYQYLDVALPSSTYEQQAISNALADMNKELEALEQRLNKTQQLKQGMMQELLTGRTRLV